MMSCNWYCIGLRLLLLIENDADIADPGLITQADMNSPAVVTGCKPSNGRLKLTFA